MFKSKTLRSNIIAVGIFFEKSEKAYKIVKNRIV